MKRPDMSGGTVCVPLSLLVEDGYNEIDIRSMCPACTGGRLHPYKLSVNLGGFEGCGTGTAFVAVCVPVRWGMTPSLPDAKGCGFSVRLEVSR